MEAKTMIRPLHGLRGLAALSVVVGHVAPVAFNPSLGVVLFFVLSGFLMGKLYLERSFTASSVREYAAARFARIYPLFACVVVGTALVNTVMGSSVFRLKLNDIPQHLLLAGPNPTIWTISVECQFYALLILVWWLSSKGWLGGLRLAALAGVLAAIGLTLAADAGRIDLLRYLFIFFGGLLVARHIHALPEALARWAAIAAIPLLAAYVAVGVLDPVGPIYDNWIAAVVCLALLASVVAVPASRCVRWLGNPVFYWLGEISFGIYLLHRHAQRVTRMVLGPDALSWLGFALTTAITLVLAHLALKLVEKPARTFLRARLTQEKTGAG